MSLEALNYPPLVGAVSLGCYGLLPVLKGAFLDDSVPWVVVQGTNVLVYGLSVWSVSRPGRYDGQAAQANNKSVGDNADPALEGMRRMGTGKKGRSLLTPAGWAFIIWAPIYIGELVMVSSQLALPEASPVTTVIREVTGSFVSAQLFQTLWTASFRPKYDQGIYKYVSAVSLSGIAISLSFCHAAFAKSDVPISTLDYWLYFLPLSLHFGWTTAASLVNWNGMYAHDDQSSAETVAWLGHASVVAATAIGVGVTVLRNAPVYGGVLCWALTAVASGLGRRIKDTEKEDPNRVGVYGVKTQRTLCLIGAVICATAATAISVVPN